MNRQEPGPGHGLSRENLLATFPLALQRDPSIAALAEGTAELLARRPEEIDQLRLYAAIDRLPEALLDILAYDFKVDWWDANYSLEEKRRTLKDSWRVHKLLGTKAAVVTAISAIFPDTSLEEWWEYGGDPYCFRLNINITDASGDAEKRRQVLSRLDFYKSLRSHVESIRYSMTAPPAHILAGGGVLGSIRQEHLPKVVLTAAPPKGEASTRSGGALAGIRGRVTARAVFPAVPAPQARGGARAGGGVFYAHRRMEANAVLPGSLRPPQARGGARAGGGVFYAHRRMEAKAVIPGSLRPPQAWGETVAGGRLFHVCRRMEAGTRLPDLPPLQTSTAAGIRTGAAGMHIRMAGPAAKLSF